MYAWWPVKRLAYILTLCGAYSWDSLPDPDAPAPKDEPGLASLYEEIRVTVGQEAQIITAVFPNPAIVMQVFLQRVFAQVVRRPHVRREPPAAADPTFIGPSIH